jgi:uridine kinase
MTDVGSRRRVLEVLAGRIAGLAPAHPTRVALDGVDAAGKTTLADELAAALAELGRPVIRASLDDFQHPRAVRYRRGPESPAGYYRDAFDLPALRAALLAPLGPGGDRRYRTATFDYRADAPVAAPEEYAPADAVLLVDGVFLQRPELAGCWEYAVFVAVPPAVALARALVRDAPRFGGAAAARARYRRRYLPAQRQYLARCRPEERADAVVGNADPAAPTLRFRA